MGTTICPDPLASSYAVLELPPGAPLAAAKHAYRRLARTYHPDTAGTAATRQFVEARSAYDAIRRGSSPGSAWRRARALDAYAPARTRPPRRVDVRA